MPCVTKGPEKPDRTSSVALKVCTISFGFVSKRLVHALLGQPRPAFPGPEEHLYPCGLMAGTTESSYVHHLRTPCKTCEMQHGNASLRNGLYSGS